jgi:hypothetical protein
MSNPGPNRQQFVITTSLAGAQAWRVRARTTASVCTAVPAIRSDLVNDGNDLAVRMSNKQEIGVICCRNGISVPSFRLSETSGLLESRSESVSCREQSYGETAPNLDNLETQDERRIVPWRCFSIEPGIYLKNLGVRPEVNVFVNGPADCGG